MATITDNGWPNLANVMRGLAPDGSIDVNVVELMSKRNPVLQDVPWEEGNLPTGHRITSRTGLPTTYWRRFNEGVPASKTEKNQWTEACGMMAGISICDVDLANLGGNAVAYRRDQTLGFMESMAQEFTRAVFYESAATSPEKVHGLSPRYGGTTGYLNSAYVLKPGTNAGVNCESIWLITWERRKIYGIYPKGSKAGLQHEDNGEQWVLDSSNLRLKVYQDYHKWNWGLAVEDYRYAVRAQWDPDDATAGASYAATGTALDDLMQSMLLTIYEKTENTRFYMSRNTRARLATQLGNRTVNRLEFVDMGGKLPVESYMGVPIRVVDGLVAESAIA